MLKCDKCGKEIREGVIRSEGFASGKPDIWCKDCWFDEEVIPQYETDPYYVVDDTGGMLVTEKMLEEFEEYDRMVRDDARERQAELVREMARRYI